MKKKKILYVSDSALALTGFGQVALRLLKSLYLTNKYDILHICQGAMEGDINLTRFPWKCIGAIPNNPQILQRMNQDPNYARFCSYAGEMLERMVLEFKPDIVLLIQDPWGASDIGVQKEFWNKTNCISWITLDSLPPYQPTIEQLTKKQLPNLYFWSSFIERECKKLGFNHVKTQFPPLDTYNFKPLSKEIKSRLKREFGISDKKFIINYTFRSQLRKQSWALIEGYSLLQQENPEIAKDVWIYFHTSTDEGWNHKRFCEQYNVDYNRILYTWICKECKKIQIKSDNGDKNCPHCKSQNSQQTCSVSFGATPEQMNLLYNISDCETILANSGATEMPGIEALACGLPLATVNYSYGVDFCEQEFVYALESTKCVEFGTQFIKVMPLASSVKEFIKKIYNSKPEEIEKISKGGRKWVIDNFSTEVVSQKWQTIFDSLPEVTWNFEYDKNLKDLSTQLTQEEFNISNDKDFIKVCYSRLLKMEVLDTDDGLNHWVRFLSQPKDKGQLRNELIMAFKNAGLQHNQKVQPNSLEILLDKGDKSRVLLVVKESLGDCYISTSLLPEIKNKYPNSSIYIATDPKYWEVFEMNENIKTCIPYVNEMENEMLMIGFGSQKGLFNYYINVAIGSQKILNYLSNIY